MQMTLHSLALWRRECLHIRSIRDKNGKAVRLQNVGHPLAAPNQHCGCGIIAHVNDHRVVEPMRTIDSGVILTINSKLLTVLDAVFDLLSSLPERHFAQSDQGRLFKEVLHGALSFVWRIHTSSLKPV